MATRDYYPAPPRAPYGGYGYDTQRGGDTIMDLILQGGDIAAQGAQRSGQIWGGAVGQLGQQAGQLGERIGAEREAKQKADQMAKRDAAWVSYVEAGEWMKDPKAAYLTARKIWGPGKESQEQFMGLQSVAQLSQKKRDPEADQKALGNIIGAMDGLAGDPARARLYPQAVALARSVYPELKLSDQFNPEEWPSISALGPSLRGDKKGDGFTLKPGEQRFGADGKPIASVAAEVEAPQPRVVGRSLVDSTGKVIYRDPESRAPREDKLERVETTGPDGKPVTLFVTPTAGASYPKPTGAGKPATGQQRRALTFMNRGKEAQEVASSLEEGGNVSALAIKVTPEWANFLRSNPNQAYVQAQRAFTEARLRKDSGAAVPKHEYETDALTYFMQPGDSPETIAQKRAGRNAILAGLAFESGDALQEFYGDEAATMISDYQKASKSGGAGTPRPKSRAEVDALPSGTVFIAPDGSRKVKP